MSTTPEVVTCGESMLLMVAEPGVPLARAGGFRSSVAGAESNVAAGLARLGHRTRWFGRLGADPAGQSVLRQLRAEGIDTSTVLTDPQAPTGLLLRDSHPARAIDVQYYRAGSAASRLAPADLSPELLSGARLLHLTGITPMLSETARRATVRLLELAREGGLAVSFDPNVRRKLGSAERWREVVGPLLRRVDLLLAGDEELELLSGRTAHQASDGLLDGEGPHTVVVKNADRSAVCSTRAGAWHQPHFPVPAVDPVGAGDGFAAGYLSGWLRGLPPGEALAEAAITASLVVQSVSDTDGLPTAAERDRALAAARNGGEAVQR